MKVGITIWNDQVSPLLDAARELLVVDTEGQTVRSKTSVQIPPANHWQRLNSIRDTGIDKIICGAISREYDAMLQSCNIEVFAWKCGRIDDVLSAFLQGSLAGPRFCLPGKTRGRRRCHGGRGRCRRRISRSNTITEAEEE
jgi:predicted Fe-Mo cluster-binding NifX family protein